MALRLGLFALPFLFGCGETCRNQVFARVDSPGGAHRAVQFQRDCGATTGFSTQISVLRAGEEPTESGNAFRADGGLAGGPRPWAQARWLSPTRLLIRYAAGARLFARADEVAGIRISYEPVPPGR